MNWLILSYIYDAMHAAVTAGLAPTAEQIEAARIRFDSRSGSAGYAVENGVATIAVEGVLTPTPDIMALIFGGGNTAYEDIIAALAAAKADPKVERARLAMDSGGGTIDGLFETIAAIQSFGKPIEADVGSLCASAAYALAAATNKINARHRATRVGSIGVAQSMRIDANRVDITSTDAPKKRPDASTPEGVAMVREELDALHALFVESIAAGRKTTVANVNANFGRGGMLLAEAAQAVGMVDSVGGQVLNTPKTTTKPASSGHNPGVKRMDLQTLKAEYAPLVAAIVAEERDRCVAHLAGGVPAGMLDQAIAAVKDGTPCSQAKQTEYMMAAINKSQADARVAADAAAAGADGAAAPTTDDKTKAEAEAAEVLALVQSGSF